MLLDSSLELDVALSLSDVEFIATLALDLVDHSINFALGFAAVCTFLFTLLLIQTKKRFWTVTRKCFGSGILNAGHNFHVDISKEHLFEVGMSLVDYFNTQSLQFMLIAEG